VQLEAEMSAAATHFSPVDLYCNAFNLDRVKQTLLKAGIGVVHVKNAGDGNKLSKFTLVHDDGHVGVLVHEENGTRTWFDSMPQSQLTRSVKSKIRITPTPYINADLQVVGQSSCLSLTVLYCALRKASPIFDHARAVSQIVFLTPFQARDTALFILGITNKSAPCQLSSTFLHF